MKVDEEMLFADFLLCSEETCVHKAKRCRAFQDAEEMKKEKS